MKGLTPKYRGEVGRIEEESRSSSVLIVPERERRRYGGTDSLETSLKQIGRSRRSGDNPVSKPRRVIACRCAAPTPEGAYWHTSSSVCPSVASYRPPQLNCDWRRPVLFWSTVSGEKELKIDFMTPKISIYHVMRGTIETMRQMWCKKEKSINHFVQAHSLQQFYRQTVC